MNEPAAGIGEEKRPDEESDSAVVDMKEREPEDILEENPNKTAESAALLDIPPEDESAGPDGEKHEAVQEAPTFRTEMHRVAAERLEVDAVGLDFLVCLFHLPSYRRCAGLGESVEESDAFRHFITHGMDTGLTPGPFFDPDFCAAALAAGEIPVEGSVLLSWLTTGIEQGVIPTPHFDAEYYLEINPDVAEVGVDPFYHFLMYGQREGRLPSRAFESLKTLIMWQAERSPASYSDFLFLFPEGCEYSLAEPDKLDEFRKMFQVDFYLAQLKDELKKDLMTEIQAENASGTVEETQEMLQERLQKRLEERLSETLDIGKALEHFVFAGSARGFRPTILFNEQYYRRELSRRIETGTTPTGTDVVNEAVEVSSLRPIQATDIPFWHWFCAGRPNRILPTPLYDEEIYCASHKDLEKWRGWHFYHYAFHGVRERFRIASSVFNANFYCSQRPEMKSKIPLVDFVIEGDSAGVRPASDVSLAAFGDTGDLRTMTRIERFAIFIQDKLARLNSPEFKPLIEHAAYIEPMVLRPYGRRDFQWPPIKHSFIAMVELMAGIRKSLAQSHYDTIVLIPHCRIAGSARVAGNLVRSLRAIYPSESLLLVLTDLSEFQRPDWFAESMHVFDLAAQMGGLTPAVRITALLDLVRGLTPRRIINVNSRLCWELVQTYGEQISTWTDIYGYLFTWDLNKQGDKGGYPINFFYPCFDAYAGIFIDNAPLAEEIADRYALSHALRKKIHLLHTAAESEDVTYEKIFESRRRQGKRVRCFWVGRFDRQKRFDMVMEIARLLPDMEILAWGKRVLNDFEVDWKSLPGNIKLHGVYEDFDELPVRSFDFFLYTSEWDGLPTILIDVGARGIATVGSRVGGTADLLSEATAWPVDDVLNPAAYVAAIAAMSADPAEVTRRAAAFRAHTLAVCSTSKYREILKAVLDGGKHVTDQG